jgi:recombination protein RecT
VSSNDSALVVYASPDEVRRDLTAMVPVLRDILPTATEQGRFVRVVAKAIIENPKLMECTRSSLVAAIHEAAQLGLEPTGLLGSAYLVPYSRSFKVGNTWHKVKEAKLIPGYRGLIDLARRSGEIDGIEAKVVRRRDHFRLVEGTNPGIEHERFVADPLDKPEERDPGPIVGFYMVATLRGGHQQTEWMTADEVDAIRKRSKAADDGPWVTDYAEMGRKTVVRRGSKYLPLTTEFRRALELDEEAERAAEPPAALAGPSRATQMLLDRAGVHQVTAGEADGAAEAGTGEAEGSPDTPEGENGSPGGSSEVVPPATGPETPPDASRVVAEAVGQGGAKDAKVVTQEPPPPPEPVREPEVCGNDGGMLGTCALSGSHRGGHKNRKGEGWPR